METLSRIKGRNNYNFPAWVSSVKQIEAINTNPSRQVCVSILKDMNKGNSVPFLDLRIWEGGKPTFAGIFINRSSAYVLRDILDSFLSGELIEDEPSPK